MVRDCVRHQATSSVMSHSGWVIVMSHREHGEGLRTPSSDLEGFVLKTMKKMFKILKKDKICTH